ncbi:dedicator of cytokinesis protein 11-like [Diadema antillarum]|uniref:dedicator of cytokinesis protein 11-like n=1 Tax=Diadema antillarum TaxID=105358 RepID=UPI003A88643A
MRNSAVYPPKQVNDNSSLMPAVSFPFSKSYKRRFFYLKQLADRSFLLEYHKDDRSTEAKGNMYLDSLVEVTKVRTREGYCTFVLVSYM